MRAIAGGLVILSGAVMLTGGMIADMLRQGALIGPWNNGPQGMTLVNKLTYDINRAEFLMLAGVGLLVVGLVILVWGLRTRATGNEDLIHHR